MAIVLSSSNSALLEPKRVTRWIIQFDRIPGNGGGTGGTNQLAFACYKGGKPKISFGDTSTKRINETWNFAGKPVWADITFGFYDFIRDKAADSAYTILNNWKNKVYDAKTGMGGYASEYKVNATLGMLDPHGVVCQTWHIFYGFPKDVNFGDVDYTQEAEAATIEMVLKYDYAIDGAETPVVPTFDTNPYPKSGFDA